MLDCENKKHDHGASISSRVIFVSTSQQQQTHQQQMQQQQQDLTFMSVSNKKRKVNIFEKGILSVAVIAACSYEMMRCEENPTTKK